MRGSELTSRPLPSFVTRQIVPVSQTPKLAPVMPTSAVRKTSRSWRRAACASGSKPARPARPRRARAGRRRPPSSSRSPGRRCVPGARRRAGGCTRRDRSPPAERLQPRAPRSARSPRSPSTSTSQRPSRPRPGRRRHDVRAGLLRRRAEADATAARLERRRELRHVTVEVSDRRAFGSRARGRAAPRRRRARPRPRRGCRTGAPSPRRGRPADARLRASSRATSRNRPSGWARSVMRRERARSRGARRSGRRCARRDRGGASGSRGRR